MHIPRTLHEGEVFAIEVVSIMELHRCMRRISPASARKLVEDRLVTGITLDPGSLEEHCLSGVLVSYRPPEATTSPSPSRASVSALAITQANQRLVSSAPPGSCIPTATQTRPSRSRPSWGEIGNIRRAPVRLSEGRRARADVWPTCYIVRQRITLGRFRQPSRISGGSDLLRWVLVRGFRGLIWRRRVMQWRLHVCAVLFFRKGTVSGRRFASAGDRGPTPSCRSVLGHVSLAVGHAEPARASCHRVQEYWSDSSAVLQPFAPQLLRQPTAGRRPSP